MRIVAGLFLLCVILVAGCSDKDKIPSGILSKEDMEKIMWDMMLADQYSANYLVKDSSRINVKLETLKLYEEIFRLHHISKDEFSKSYAFYQSRPDIARVLFDSLLARGTRARMENYARPPGQGPSTPSPAAATPPSARPRPMDSIRNRALRNGRPGIVPGKPGANVPGNNPPVPGGNKPAHPNGQSGFFPDKPGILPSGTRPFLKRGAHPLKAGEMPFKQVKKDSVPKGRQ